MATRRHYPHGVKKRWTRDLALLEPYSFGLEPRSLLTVQTYLPLSVARRVRNKVYTYPLPVQRSLAGRVIRYRLLPPTGRMVRTKVRIRLPRILPRVRGSYVSLRRGRLNIHSRKQLHAALARGEVNQRRYQEHKTHRRHARNGQLDSPGARAFGSVSHALGRGWSIGKIADAALAARAILKGGW